MLEQRTVRYKDLIPCTNAFIDTRSPGSDQKENFTIIGPGVAENPNQHVHINIAHGFNIGGARQPPKCLNSQHSHLTAEVFVAHSGSWDFITGVNGDDGRITLHEGDIISIPTDVFRGFENSGDKEGYLHAVLGGDDPGRVLWAPAVFDMARDFGLVLLEDGSLVDTTRGETVPAHKKPMPVTSDAQINTHRIISSAMLNDIVIRKQNFDWRTNSALAQFSGVEEAALVGKGSSAEGLQGTKLNWEHGFAIRALKLSPGAEIKAHIRQEEEVIFVHQGSLNVGVGDANITLGKGDNFTTPVDAVRMFSNRSDQECIVYVTRGGDQPKPPKFL